MFKSRRMHSLYCSPKQNNIPGWNDLVETHKREALTWHMLWKAQGQPHSGYVAKMRRITRARYHHAAKTIKRDSDTIGCKRWLKLVIKQGIYFLKLQALII